QGAGLWLVGGQLVLQGLDLVVEGMYGVEVAVHHVVEQSVQQERHAVLGQIWGGVPPGGDRVDVEPLVLADGDQGVGGDERRGLTGVQRTGVRVQPDGVRGDEQVAVVARAWAAGVRGRRPRPPACAAPTLR